MNKKFKVKAVFLLAFVFVCALVCFVPNAPLKADTESSNISVYYALLSLGYSDAKDKNSLVVEEYIGVELDTNGLSDSDKTTLTNNVFGELKSYKTQLDTLINIGNLSASIITTDAKTEGNLIYVKVRYLNLPAYYVFNGRVIPDENTTTKPYDSMEKGLFYNKYNIILGNPFGAKGAQTSLNLFRDNFYEKVLNHVRAITTNFNTDFVFDYSASDDRLYGDYSSKYSITGVNSNTIYVYEFVFKEDIPDTVSMFFITFNQYMWYVVAIAITLIVIGVLYLIVFIKGKKDRKSTQETENNMNNNENLLNTNEK